MNCDSNQGGTSGNSSNEGGNGAGETEEDGDDPSSSSSFQTEGDNNSELHLFRQQWQKQIRDSTLKEVPHHCIEKNEEQARELYMEGVEAERKGHLCDAIYFYRRAVQLVPDIEFRVASFLSQSKRLGEDNVSDEEFNLGKEEYMELAGDDEDDDDLEMDDLVARFIRLNSKSDKICQPHFDQIPCHISVLPSEILLYIFKWVVSSELDMLSLEQLSCVSRGFYICARDAELWRIACLRIWGNSCVLSNKYDSWRNMFIKRPRLHCNGVYISKTTYVRPGEPAFQDLTYRPWHLIEYYRYIRFFPGGFLHMMTTPEEPAVSVGKLRNRNIKNHAILSGHYRIHGSLITAIMKRSKTTETSNASHYRYRRHQQNQTLDNHEQTFHVEFEVMNYKSRNNFKLEWRHYSIRSVSRNGQESVSDFNLSNVKYPPLWFSRVKSFTATSDRPLS